MRPGFFICICPDFEIIKDFIQNAVQGFEGKWEEKVFWGDEEDLSSFFSCFRTSNLSGIKQALVLRNAQKANKSFWDKISHFLRKFYPSVCVFICIESEWIKGVPKKIKDLESKKFYKLAKKKKWIFTHPGVDEGFLENYIKDWAKRNKINLRYDVKLALKELLPKDFKGIKQELRKLELYIDKNTELDLSKLSIISPSLEYNIFDIINSIEEIPSEQKLWSMILKYDFSSSETVMPLLHLFLREARIFWKLLHGDRVSLPNWVLKKKEKLAKKLGREGIIKIWDIILDADFKLKTSNLTPEEVFQYTVVKLHQLFT